MKNDEKIKLILSELRQTGKTLYTKREIDRAIQRSLLVVDERTLDKWFDFLFRLEYLEQSKLGYYSLVGESVKEAVHTHTHNISKERNEK